VTATVTATATATVKVTVTATATVTAPALPPTLAVLGLPAAGGGPVLAAAR